MKKSDWNKGRPTARQVILIQEAARERDKRFIKLREAREDKLKFLREEHQRLYSRHAQERLKGIDDMKIELERREQLAHIIREAKQVEEEFKNETERL